MGVGTVEFEGGLITAHRLHFQELSIMTQMGLMPSPGAAPAQEKFTRSQRKETNMYGTIGHLRIKPGMEGQFRQLLQEQARAFEAGKIQGYLGTYAYRMDADPSDYYLAVVFSSKEAYIANANSAAQDARYRQWLPLLMGEPEWHDGEIVGDYALQGQG
jgi:quinol monooxygenase YgiN